MKTANKPTLNAYEIRWATLIPVKGGVTKRDLKEMVKAGITYASYHQGMEEISIHAPNRRMIEEKLNKLKGKLHKPYQVYIYTDKQFAVRQEGVPVIDILTEKQKAEGFVI